MKQMRKIISLVLAFVMVMSVTAGIDFSALAADTDTKLSQVRPLNHQKAMIFLSLSRTIRAVLKTEMTARI